MKSHVFLVGFMGAGKSSVARILAERLGRPFVDLDAEIERDADTTIPVIFAEKGEDAFRDMETAHLAALREVPPAVVACGGGVVVRPENRVLLGTLGKVVYLQVTAAEALARIGDADTRPLLAGSGGPLAATTLLQARESLYRSVADIAIETVGRTPDEVADHVARYLAGGRVSETNVHVHVGGQPYEVTIGPGVMSRVGELLRPWTNAKRAALITDTTVAERYGLIVSASLARAEFEVLDLAIAPGEGSKSWDNAGQLLEALADHEIGRTDIVVALGGGVVGDLAGFVAATYLRGIAFAQIPTTLLAMVDSSVGGKTGVDLRAGKNLAGAFKQPLAVAADTNALASLSDDEWRSGLAEIAKSAIIDGEDFTAWLESNAGPMVERDAETVAEAVRRCVEFKAGVVNRDEKEEGPRECLNYGHTLGHAAEKVAGYGTITHGAAVAEGMRFASRLAMELAGADAAFVKRQDRLLASLGLRPLEVRLDPADVLSAMRSDKKARDGAVRFVLASEPGEWRCEAVPEHTLTAHLEAWAATKKGEQE